MKEQTEAEKIGNYILLNLKKLMNGEHKGIAAECTIVINDNAIVQIRISMPMKMEQTTRFDESGNAFNDYVRLTWNPEKQDYNVNDFI